MNIYLFHGQCYNQCLSHTHRPRIGNTQPADFLEKGATNSTVKTLINISCDNHLLLAGRPYLKQYTNDLLLARKYNLYALICKLSWVSEPAHCKCKYIMVLKQLCVYVENSVFHLFNMWLPGPWKFIRLSWLYLKISGSNWGQKTPAHIKYANPCAGHHTCKHTISSFGRRFPKEHQQFCAVYSCNRYQGESVNPSQVVFAPRRPIGIYTHTRRA